MQWAIIPEIGAITLVSIKLKPCHACRLFFNNIFNQTYTYMYESYLIVSDLTIFNVNLRLSDGLRVDRTNWVEVSISWKAPF